MEILGLTLLLWTAGAAAQAPRAPACPVPGEKIWWIADYCMAKRYFKRQLCQVVQKGRASECARDPNFAGPTVRNGGVGR